MADENLNKLLFRIRSLDDCLTRARFNRVEIYTQTRDVRVIMICDNAVSEDLRAAVLDVLNRELPESFRRIMLEIKKIKSDAELISREIYSYVKENCKAVAHSVSADDIKVEIPPLSQENGGFSRLPIKFSLAVDRDMAVQFENRGALRETENYLSRSFCDDFRGEIILKDTETDFSVLKEKPVQIDYVTYRSIKVDEILPLDGLIGTDRAVYIDDIRGEMDSVYLCGEIISVRERATVTGKPFYLIEFTDRTGTITGKYFNKKTTEDKIRKLKEGDGILVQGSMDTYRDRLSLTIKKINYCRFPRDFTPERKPSRPAPAEYTNVFPEKVTEYKQNDIFTPEAAAPECLKGKTFVVFDLETTGTETATDMVTEIGAVKIADGVITEKFGTLINPQVKIPEKIVGITGITDAMVADKPPFSAFSGDIYKFFEGAVLVAHNAEFDCKFLKRLSAEDGYYYYNGVIDTVQFARDTVKGLNNYKLDTVCEHFGIKFLHHRAWADAYATAQMFIELVRTAGKLPRPV
ncbi:MAG: hypothetical protein J6Z34_01570 [Clostridia bacterium]|nr:hypothetical protein [Clostridia bacterium]